MDRRHSILIELLRHESLPLRASCSHCQQSPGTHRCQDCFGSKIWCDECCVSAHTNLPFHRVQIWNGRFFEKSNLFQHQLTLDLCHHPNSCPPVPPNVNTRMMSDIDIFDEGDEGINDSELPYPPESATHVQSRSNLVIISSTGIFKRSVRWCLCTEPQDKYIQLLNAKLFPASFKNPQTVFTFEVLDHFRVDALSVKPLL